MPLHKKVVKALTIQERRYKVAQLYLQGHIQFTIAAMLGVAQTLVSKDIEAIRKEWLAERLDDFNLKMEREVRGLDMQESCLWEAWYNSCKKEIISTVTRRKELQSPPPTKKRKGSTEDTISSPEKSKLVIVQENEKITTRDLIGDPRYMSEITRIRELRCKLLGLLEDKPIEQSVVNIWQQLQEINFDRGADEIETRLKEIESRPVEKMDTPDGNKVDVVDKTGMTPLSFFEKRKDEE